MKFRTLLLVILWVLLIEAPVIAQADDVVWEGPVELRYEGTSSVPIPISVFADAREGDVLQFGIDDLKIGAVASVYYATSSGWVLLPGSNSSMPLKGNCMRFEITDEVATVLHGGCGAQKLFVNGNNFTLLNAEIVDASSLNLVNVNVSHDLENMVFYNQTPTLSLTYSNANGSDESVKFDAKVYNDRRESIGQVSVEATDGSASIELPIDDAESGIFMYELYANGEFIEGYNIAFNPLDINPGSDAMPDFDEFWSDAKAQLASVDMDVKMTRMDDISTDARTIYLVEMKSIPDGLDGEPVVIRGYYAEPNGEGTYPAIITFQGYNTSGGSYIMNANSNPDFAEFVISTRGQSLNFLPGEQNIYGEPMVFNLGNKDSYYYRGAYMDVVRAIDFVASRGKVQKNNIFAVGGSQGGAFTMVAAALGDGRIKAATPSITFLGDFPNNFMTSNWPGSVFRAGQAKYGLSDDQMFEMLSYFDIKNLAPLVHCPVDVSISLQDNACPPCTTFAIYNSIASDEKKHTVNPLLMHTTPPEWYSECMQFIRSHVTEPEEPEEPELEPCDAPVISLENLTIKVSGSVPDAVYHTNIKAIDHGSLEHSDADEIDLTGVYEISSYATAEGYGPSLVANATLVWVKTPEGNVDVLEVGTERPVLVYSVGDYIVVSGLSENEAISLMDITGIEQWSGTASGETFTIPMNLNKGQVYLIKVGNRTFKYKL